MSSARFKLAGVVAAGYVVLASYLYANGVFQDWDHFRLFLWQLSRPGRLEDLVLPVGAFVVSNVVACDHDCPGPGPHVGLGVHLDDDEGETTA
ncbi:hypothetical protein ACFFR3_46225 [Nonomuraea salmonea]|uniref:DUF2637 domain-containing protein n=1 Tax=Nonomuraea salmonea TaxID=46181 RepID=A0ABV5P307_9ACTN